MENMVVQFNETHKWCGCLGIISEAKPDINRYLIGVPVPQRGTAYIFAQREEFEVVGVAALVAE